MQQAQTGDRIVAPLAADHPVMVAWREYQAVPEYANARHWAADPGHVDGSLWAAFWHGWNACNAVAHNPQPAAAESRPAAELVEAAQDLVDLVLAGATVRGVERHTDGSYDIRCDEGVTLTVTGDTAARLDRSA